MVIGNFLLKIADRDVERASGQKICRSIVRARLGKLPVCGSSGKIDKTEGSKKYDKGENNDERSAFGCANLRMTELFHKELTRDR